MSAAFGGRLNDPEVLFALKTAVKLNYLFLFCAHCCKCVTMSDPLELELQTAVSSYMGAGN